MERSADLHRAPITYEVRYDDDSGGTTYGKPVVLRRTDSLEPAIAAAEAAPHKAYVVHIASGLHRVRIQDRFVWLDPHGREHPQPTSDR